MTERTRSRPSTVAAIVAPGAAALLSAATAFALHHSPAPAPKAAPVGAAAPKTRTDDAAVAHLRRQTKTADAELKRLRAQLAQVNSELAKARSAPIVLPRVAAAGRPAGGVPAAAQAQAQAQVPAPAAAAPAPAAPAPAAPAAAAPAPAAPAPPPPVDASTGAS